MDTLSPQQLYSDLQNNLRFRHPVHPPRKLLLTGGLTKEKLQRLAKNQFYEFWNIHISFRIPYQRCPIPELRRVLLENMRSLVSTDAIQKLEFGGG